MTIPAPRTQQADPAPAFDMKAGSYTLPCLVVREDDADALGAYLAEQIARLPRFFEQAPVVIDLGQYPADQPLHSFPMIVGTIRGYGMIPVGVRGAPDALCEQARLLELAVMPKLRQRRKEQSVTGNAGIATERPHATTPTLVVEQPVRSGQRIYARDGDLVLLAGVSSGAEVMADGHIHAYGPVRGRILAGVRDNAGARIFCRDMGAELVAIAGHYQVSEDLPSEFMRHPVQIALRGDALEFSSL